MSALPRSTSSLTLLLGNDSSQPIRPLLPPSGIWAPGQRVMGNMRFASKALLICLMFVLPMAWLTWGFYVSQKTAIDFSAKEVLGIQYNREIFPVLNLAQQLRRDATSAAVTGTPPATLSEVKSQLQAQQAKLAEVDKRLGASLETAKAYSAVQAGRTFTPRRPKSTTSSV